MSICDMDGIARVSEASIHRIANVTEDEAADALRVLLSPDPNSRDPENEGRRIEKTPGGFKLLNYFKYRNIKPPKHRAEYMRDYMKKYRKDGKSKKKLTWRDSNIQEASEAIQVQSPIEMSPEVNSAISDFFQYRFDLATKPLRKEQCIRFTVATAKQLIESALIAEHGKDPARVAQKIRSAISASYREPNFHSLFQ